MALQGNLETIQDDGLIAGWCWDPTQPQRRVRLTVLVDNEPIGQTTADVFRADLEGAGIGDGCFAFSYLLPWSAIASRSVATVRVCDAETGEHMGGALTFRRTSLVPVEQRLAALEQTVRLLEARLSEAEGRARREAGLTRSMFGAIGSFFTQLAEIPVETLGAAGSLPAMAPLALAQHQHPPFALAVAPAPIMTLCLLADGPLGEAYAALAALHASGVDRAADILLLDCGLTEERAILPALVQNLRYWRLAAGESPLLALNRAASFQGHDLFALLPASAQPAADWLDALQETLAAHPDCAVLACRTLAPDGTVLASALLPDRAGRLADFAFGEPAEVPRIDRLRPVAAARAAGLVIRSAVFRALDGFDPGFAPGAEGGGMGLGAAVADLCLRAWEAGSRVLYQPRCTLRAQAEGGTGDFGAAAEDPGLATLLADRWETVALRRLPFASGSALIIDDAEAAGPATIAEHAGLLQHLGYEVSFGAMTGLDREPAGAALLRDRGIIVLRAPFQPSVAATIKNATPPFTLIEISARAALQLAPETLRYLSPKSRIILRLDAAAAVSLAEGDGDDPAVERLRKIARACDGVVGEREIPPERLAGGESGGKPPLLLSLAPKGAAARRGVWLVLDGGAETSAATDAWLATLVPAIAKALPKCQLHAKRQPQRPLPKGITLHAPSTCDGALLGQFRLALAPFKEAGADRGAIEACLAAALPVVATAPALPTGEEPPGATRVAPKDAAIIRLLRQLVQDDDAWAALAAPLLAPLTGEPAAAAYAAMLDKLATAG
ncbi:hypothetical protein [Acidisoma sp. C75]